MSRLLNVSILFLFLVMGIFAQVRTDPEPGPKGGWDGKSYVVRFRAGVPEADRAAAVGRARALLKRNFSRVAAAAVEVPNANVLAALRAEISILDLIPDREVEVLGRPDGVGANARKPRPPGTGGSEVVPEGVKRVGQPASASVGSTIGVAVVDTGVDLANADLKISSAKFDAFGGNAGDGHGHGTHVAGTVGAKQGNGLGVVGVAPGAAITSVRVLNNSGSGNDSTIMAGLQWILDNADLVTPKIRVVNMSLGRPGSVDDNIPMRELFQQLHSRGIAVVVAAGNDPNMVVSQQVPATYPEVLAVASTTAIAGVESCAALSAPIAADTASYFTTDGALSTQNIGVTISAPGEDKEDVTASCFISPVGILSLARGGGTTRMYGTSMASPHVAGVVARLMEAGVAGVETLRARLRLDATLKGTAPRNSPSSAYTFDGEREGVAQAP
jgi:subtilisin family serine protease